MAYLSPEELDRRIMNEPDFVNARRLGYSLERLLDKHPEGVPVEVVAVALNMSEEAVELVYGEVVEKLRGKMKVKITR